MAELFLVNGDMSAWLYTGSQAMHSERILIFEPESSKLRKAGVGAYGNIMVGIKRRYNNVLVDTDKQQQIEMFLGMKHALYFPQVKLYYKVRRGEAVCMLVPTGLCRCFCICICPPPLATARPVVRR